MCSPLYTIYVVHTLRKEGDFYELSFTPSLQLAERGQGGEFVRREGAGGLGDLILSDVINSCS